MKCSHDGCNNVALRSSRVPTGTGEDAGAKYWCDEHAPVGAVRIDSAIMRCGHEARYWRYRPDGGYCILCESTMPKGGRKPRVVVMLEVSAKAYRRFAGVRTRLGFDNDSLLNAALSVFENVMNEPLSGEKQTGIIPQNPTED